MIRVEVKERFEDKFKKLNVEECWIWEAGKQWQGYGKFKLNYKTLTAHRVSYELYKGEIPQGILVLHKCDNPSCVNPDHLFLGTYQQNMMDKVKKKRGNCPSGSSVFQAKLTIYQVRRLREFSSVGINQYKLAEMFKISTSAVGAIVRGETYKDRRYYN